MDAEEIDLFRQKLAAPCLKILEREVKNIPWSLEIRNWKLEIDLWLYHKSPMLLIADNGTIFERNDAAI